MSNIYTKIVKPDYKEEKGFKFEVINKPEPLDIHGKDRVKKHYDMMRENGYKQIKVWVKPINIANVKSFARNCDILSLSQIEQALDYLRGKGGLPVQPEAPVKPEPVKPEPVEHEQLGHIEALALPKVIAFVKMQNKIAAQLGVKK